jgi:Zn-dependent peptidase ImmA (M78 family)/transcriptional regulator with XRE-family HTH domain
MLDESDGVCENRTMADNGSVPALDLGRRISQARQEAGMTQADLGHAIGLDRTSIAKLETGARKVSATELVAIASALDRPIDWFVVESPPSVVSRRTDAAVGGRSPSMDIKVDRLARDVAFLIDQGILADASERPAFELPSDVSGAEVLAAQARQLMGVTDGPLYDLQRACERVGLLAFSLHLGEGGGDAAYVEVGNRGVALINGDIDPGRRRFDLAHELGHHLFGDAYAPEIAVTGGEDVERLINAFAIHVLLPREPVTALWRAVVDHDTRLAAVAVSVRFRASWTATCSQLRNLGLIDAIEREQFIATPPTAADFVALGERWEAELQPPAIPPEYGKRVLGAYQAGRLSASRTVELLWGTVAIEELPEQRAVPLESLRREFDRLP